MAKGAKKVRTDPADSVKELSAKEEALGRNEELSTKRDVKEALIDIFKDVEKGFDKQCDRSDDNMDWWDCYNCILGNKQFYQGTSQIFVPIVYNAINARKTRFVNQLFPISGRFVEVTTEDGSQPYTEMALLEHYVRSCKIRSRVAPALMKNSDIEGHMTIQVTWEEHKRHIVQKVKKPVEVDLEAGLHDEDEVDDIEELTVSHAGPVVRVIADSDICVLPATSNSIEEALADGGTVTTLCRWSPATIKRKIKEGAIEKEAGDDLLVELLKVDNESSTQLRDKPKEMVDAAGIKGTGRGKYALIYRTWVMLTIEGERRLCLAYYGGKERILSCKRNPYWCDRVDIISAPIDKVDGSFKGISRVKPGVADLQYQANDATNEGMDSAAYALMPIIMTDPEKNPKVGQMVLTMAAIWETNPSDTQFAKFPPLWKDALEIVASCQQQIFQTLSVNPAMITQGVNPKKKPNQAEIANEQQIDILTTADVVTTVEDEILSPMLLFMLELDHQYRDRELFVRQYGETGMKTNMLSIPPLQMNKLYQFRWFGVEAARNAQLMQQQISGINVIKGVPPNLYPGYKLDLGAVLSTMVESLFGPRLAPLTFRSAKEELGFPPEVENQILADQFLVPVHALDNHQQHIKVHQQLAQQTGDPSGVIRVHIMMHMQALQQAQQAQQMAALGAQQQGAGGPRQGAQAKPPRGGQQPPGSIQRDAMGRNAPGAPPRPQ